MLLSSHNMAEVERACDRVAMIHEGRILEIETVASLLERSPKAVRAVFADPVSADLFSALPGVTDVVVDGNAVDLKVSGSVDGVLGEVARHSDDRLHLRAAEPRDRLRAAL